jgi:hypothetical protein
MIRTSAVDVSIHAVSPLLTTPAADVSARAGNGIRRSENRTCKKFLDDIDIPLKVFFDRKRRRELGLKRKVGEVRIGESIRISARAPPRNVYRLGPKEP